jgi:hypothetical protein
LSCKRSDHETSCRLRQMRIVDAGAQQDALKAAA